MNLTAVILAKNTYRTHNCCLPMKKIIPNRTSTTILWQAVFDKSPPRLRQVPAAFAAGTRWIYSRYLLNLRRLPAEFAAGTCWFRGRYPLDLRQVPARFAAGTCWFCSRYLLDLRQVP